MKKFYKISIIILIVIIALLLIGFTVTGRASNNSNGLNWGRIWLIFSGNNRVTTPISNPVGGNYTHPVLVYLSTNTYGTTVRYTLNGVNPSTTYGDIWYENQPIYISSSMILKAIAYKDGYTNSHIMTQQYIIDPMPEQVEKPTCTIEKINNNKYEVTLSRPTGYEKYTTDGSTPGRYHGNRYTGPFIIDDDFYYNLNNLRYMAYDNSNMLKDSFVSFGNINCVCTNC